MGVGVSVGRDDVSGGGAAGDDPELASGLGAADQHGEQVAEQLRVLSLATPQEECLRGAGQQTLPLRTVLRVDQVLKRHRLSRILTACVVLNGGAGHADRDTSSCFIATNSTTFCISLVSSRASA
jgi:hypothetical protein